MGTNSTKLDEAAVASYLSNEFDDHRPVSIDTVDGGNANETFTLEWGDEAFVLRKPPTAEPAPELLHDLSREYEVLDALEETWVPSPGVLTFCQDEYIIGSTFYVMERHDGEIIELAPPAEFQTPEAKRRIGAETLDTLAKIHHIDIAKIGLASFGDGDDYLRRQVEQLTTQLEWAQEVTVKSRELDICFEVADWLDENVPESHHQTLVHGDYKLDNIVFTSEAPPRARAILDWEMATLGDPLADLGWLLSYWTESKDPSPVTDDIRNQYSDHDYFPMLDVYTDEYSKFMREDGYHTRRELVERYEKQTGFEYTNDRFYRALGVFKLAALCDGFYRMYLEDAPNTKESYPLMELMVPTLGRQAKQIIDGKTPL